MANNIHKYIYNVVRDVCCSDIDKNGLASNLIFTDELCFLKDEPTQVVRSLVWMTMVRYVCLT